MKETEKSKAPKIRFAGFTDDWEQRKMSEIFEIITDYVANGSFASLRKNVSYSEKKDYAIVIRLTDFNNKYQGPFLYTSKGGYDFLKKSYLLSEDILISNVGAHAGQVYKAPKIEQPMTLGPNSILVRTSTQNREFMYQLMKSNVGEKKIKTQISVSAQPKFNKTDFRQITFKIPCYFEQDRISSFFEKIDNLITLHQRQLDSLKKAKKSFLQKLFPKNGAVSPEIRFAGFTDDWEQRKLGELGSVAMNKRIFKDQTSENGDIPFYKIGTFGKKPDSFITRELFEEYKQKYPYPRVGDILISASGSIGRTVVYQGKDEYFQDSNIVWLKHDNRLSNDFLKQFYLIVKWQGLEGSTIKRLYNKNILKTKIVISSIDEQTKIGNFFNHLDQLITLHQRKLDTLKKMKKALLQQMFI